MNAVDHNNVVIFDDRGIPSIMCRFVRPKDTEEVPAVFKIGDKVADAIYISKYPNIVIDGRAYSMPMADPTVNITFDGAVQACRCKGLGWHLMTAVEYEYLLNQSREKGTMPHGNTDWGKDYYHNDEQGKVSNLGRTYTGTGPVTWNHDHTPYGVSDLNGNVWEWLAGLRDKFKYQMQQRQSEQQHKPKRSLCGNALYRQFKGYGKGKCKLFRRCGA